MVASLCWRRYASLALLLLLALVGWLSDGADACSCIYLHPQQHYCSADFVIRARVVSMRREGYWNYFRVKVNKVFKESAKASLKNLNVGEHEIASLSQSTACGIDLEKGKTYLLTGHEMLEKLSISSCDFIRQWSSLTAKQKKGVRLLYERACNCEVLSCSYWEQPNCVTSTTDSQCFWDSSDCQSRETVCARQGHGRCAWTSSVKYRQCRKNT